ncbi:MAG: hypothetical protein LBH00_06835 [Planctomycetaceae bacterium]|nr:hypothetical protein [Planctomycetaceae bacterium]
MPFLQNGFRNHSSPLGGRELPALGEGQGKYSTGKHVFRSAALGEVWTFLTGMAGAVVCVWRRSISLCGK